MQSYKRVITGVIAIGALMSATQALAGTDTQNLGLSAEIQASCVFGAATTLPFGDVTISDLVAGKAENTPADVKITCANSGVDAKLYAAATRTMSDGSAGVLAYEVYTDAGRTVALGSDLANGAAVTADGTEQSIPLYGKISAAQETEPVGAYTANLALTVEF